MKHLEKPLKALANRRRLAILRYIKKSRQATVSDIAEEIRLSFKSTSRHLAILRSADLLEREQKSRLAYYRLSEDTRTVIKNVIDEL